MVTDVEKFKAVQTLLMHRLITKEDLNAMRVNRVFGEDKSTEPSGVVRVKLFCGSSTWLLSEFDEKNGLFFGLCDLGHGCPELGYVGPEQLASLVYDRGDRGKGLVLERDKFFEPTQTLEEYATKSREQGFISV